MLGPAVGALGSLQAVEVVKEILELGESLSGTLLLYDALAPDFRRLTLPVCPIVRIAAAHASPRRDVARPRCKRRLPLSLKSRYVSAARENGDGTAEGEQETIRETLSGAALGPPFGGQMTSVMSKDTPLFEQQPYMNDRHLEYFKTKLLAWRDDILKGSNQTLQQLREEENRIADLSDWATAEIERSYQLRARDRERKLLSKIEQALKRIEDGPTGFARRPSSRSASNALTPARSQHSASRHRSATSGARRSIARNDRPQGRVRRTRCPGRHPHLRVEAYCVVPLRPATPSS